MNEVPERMRLDKWLWCARFYKTRSLATAAVKAGKVLCNDARAKPARTVAPGDRLSLRRGPFRYSITVQAIPRARLSAAEAAGLYTEDEAGRAERELLAAQIRAQEAMYPRSRGRPTKRERRVLLRFTGRERRER